MLATVAPRAHLPMAGVFAISPQVTSPKGLICCPGDGLWWITVTPRTPGVARRLASTCAGTLGTSVEAGQDVDEKLQKRSARVLFPALPPPGLLAAAIELRAPITALVMKSASTSPLMNRKAARGLSRSRRPAMRVAGRFARLVMSREPAVVNHGPAEISPTTRSTKPTSSSRSWLPLLPGFPATSKYASIAIPARSGMSRTTRARWTRLGD